MTTTEQEQEVRDKVAESHEAKGQHALAAACRLTHNELVLFACYISGRSPKFFAEAVRTATGRDYEATS